jgi:phosphoglycolate phosphatase-like HAD superfamily hydrolase
MKSHPIKLLLFDIDGTLVRGKTAMYYKLFEELVHDLWEKEISLNGYSFSGRTDKEIIAHIADLAEISEDEFERAEEELISHFPKRLERIISKESFELLPNVVPLLEELSAREDMLVALLTGNLPECAQLKLGIYDLEKYFEFGVYGIESRNRNDLGPIALHRAEEHTNGKKFEGRDVVIIGDAVNDVLCAQAIGAKCIVTLTGKTLREEIDPLMPDHILPNLADRDIVMSAILS